jgi:hypothetical protein
MKRRRTSVGGPDLAEKRRPTSLLRSGIAAVWPGFGEIITVLVKKVACRGGRHKTTCSSSMEQEATMKVITRIICKGGGGKMVSRARECEDVEERP